jgi:hypothetical protein
MDRVKEFLGDRLRGRAVPEDLRRLVEMQLDGELEGSVAPFCDIRVLGPGEGHPLEEPVKPLPSDDDPAATRANDAAIHGVLEHVAAVVNGIDGNLWGYWLHPDEPADRNPFVLKLSTEGEFGLLSCGNLVESIVFDWAGEDDVSAVVTYCEQKGIPFTARADEDIRGAQPVVDPATLHEKLYKRLHPYHRRPAWADESGAVPDVAPIGQRWDDPRVARALALHGFADGPVRLVTAADEGIGEVVLRAATCSAAFEFHREDDTTWFLHEMRFFDRGGELPVCTHLPFGLTFKESREQCIVRLGEPSWKSPLGGMESWSFGRVQLHVKFGKNGTPSTVRCMEKHL